MKRTDSMPFARKIRLRIWGCWAAIVVMTVYMLVLVEIGGGDSRIMTRTAELVTRLLYFGGLIFLIVRSITTKSSCKTCCFCGRSRKPSATSVPLAA